LGLSLFVVFHFRLGGADLCWFIFIMNQINAKTFFLLLVISISSIHGAHIQGDEDTPPKVAATPGFVSDEAQMLDDLERDFEIQRAADANKVSCQTQPLTNASIADALALVCSCTRCCGAV
jgi:hypothetical protein